MNLTDALKISAVEIEFDHDGPSWGKSWPKARILYKGHIEYIASLHTERGRELIDITLKSDSSTLVGDAFIFIGSLMDWEPIVPDE